jgi:hypothetical protein
MSTIRLAQSATKQCDRVRLGKYTQLRQLYFCPKNDGMHILDYPMTSINGVEFFKLFRMPMG